MDLATVLSSTLLAALIAALVSLRSSERKIHVENVTQERAKWRKAMRELADAIIKGARAGDPKEVGMQCAQLALNVNPFDAEDRGLVHAAETLTASSDLDASVREFTDRMALLLKHDWERAKREAHPWFFRGSEPRRVPYSECKCTAGNRASSTPGARPAFALVGYFATLSFSAGVIFFLAVGLTEPFQTLVKIFNDSKVDKPAIAWFQFLLWSVLCGSMWSGAYLWFKGSEKKFLDIWFSK